MATILSTKEISAHLQELKGWALVNNAIQKEWVFKDFKTALNFINSVGLLAERHDHHPEIFNSYNRVQLRLSTHSAKGLTQRDFSLAKAIDQLL